jgi:hypothetical protein
MKKAFLGFAILAMISLVSCTKPGPEGPQGPAGTNGTNGAAGTNGTNGIDGNANVIGSNTIVVNNWVSISDDGTYFTYNSTLTWASITQAIVDKGVVLVYFQDGLGWRALPYTATGQQGSITVGYKITVGTVTLICEGYSTLGSPGAAALNGDTYRIVAIPASVAAANPNVNWGNYEEVMKILK